MGLVENVQSVALLPKLDRLNSSIFRKSSLP